MKESKFSLEKIKNWFIILGIKLANFIKEHKYVSAGIGVLICTCVIVMVAFASDTDPNEGKISVDSLNVSASNESEQTLTEAPSFSTVNYTVDFKLKCKDNETCTASNRKAVIEASIPANIDAEWIAINSNETISKIEKGKDYNKIILTVNDGISLPATAEDGSNTESETKSRTIYLELKNISNDTEITPTITVYEATTSDDNDKKIENSTTVKVKSEEINLTSKIVGGYKYLEGDSRYVPFGVILGYEGENLTGKYFSPNQSVSVKGTLGEEFDTDKAGVYDVTKNNYISKDKMPHYKYDTSLSTFVYDSGSATLTKKSDSLSNEYLLDITELKSDGYTDSYKDGNFIKLGSYYVIAKTSVDKESITVNIGNESYTMSNLTTEDVGTQTIDAVLTPESTSNEKTLAYGEAANLNIKFTHSIDSSKDLDSVVITVPINDNFDLEKYSSESDYNINEEYKNIEDNIKTEALYICSEEGTGSTYDEAKANSNCGRIKSVSFTIKNVLKGSNVNIDLRLRVNSDANTGELTYEKVSANYNGTSKESSTVNKVVITPFKARAKVTVNGKENDNIIDMTNSSSTNIKVYPSIYSPSTALNSTVITKSLLNLYVVQIDLPKGIEYIENSSNLSFSDQKIGDITRLTYGIQYDTLNSSINSISFDVKSDLDSSGTKNIDVKVQSFSGNSSTILKALLGISLNNKGIESIEEIVNKYPDDTKLMDSSSISDRTVTKVLTYQNSNNSLLYRNNATNLYINKKDSFGFETEIYNPTEDIKNFDLILKLPSKESEDAAYTGEYTVSGVPDGALCSFTYDNIQSVDWQDCPDEISDSSVKLIKFENISLESKKYYKNSITIKPENNKVGDKYKYSSSIVIDDDTKEIPAVVTSVYTRRITGNVWEDFNDNGIMDEDEEKVEGIEFFLHKVTYKNSEKTEITSDEVVSSTKSNYKGDYEFLAYDDGSEIEYGYYYIETKFYNQKYGLTAYREDISSDYNKSKFKATNEDTTEESDHSYAKTDVFEVGGTSRKNITDKNLGLTLKKVYNIKISKYLTKAVTTNALGISTTKEFGDKVTFAKLDVKDINNLTIKVIYTIEVQNTGYYPGYVSAINDYMPDGMSFNKDYEENKNWVLNDNGTLVYDGLKDTLIKGSEKKYVTLALDITSKEAGSFVNYASVTNDDIKIFSRNNDLLESGDTNE